MNTSGEREKCPACGSSNVRYAVKDEIPTEEVVLYRFRFCEDCRHAFQPGPPSRAAMFRLVFGIVMSLSALSFAFDRSPSTLTYIGGGFAALTAAICFYGNIRDLIAARRAEAESAQSRQFNEQ